MLEKAAALKRFEYSPLGKELKTQADIAKKQYQKLDDTDEFDETINNRFEYVDLSGMPPAGSDEEEVKEGKGLKTLTPNKLLTKLPILLAQIKAGNNSYKLKNEIRQILYLSYQHNKITKEVYNNLFKSL